MAYYQRLLDNVSTRCPGVVPQALLNELWNVVDDACRRGWIWVVGIEVDLQANDTTYSLTSGIWGNFRIVHVITIEHDTYDVSRIVVEDASVTLPEFPSATDVATPLRVQAVIVPSDSADLLDEMTAALFSRNFQLFLDGCLARLYSHPAKPYTNMVLAGLHARLFNNALHTERHRLRTGDQPDRNLFRFPRHTM